MATYTTAICCAATDRPGAAHVTSLTGHHPRLLRCSECVKEYSVDYNPSDLGRIPTFEGKLLLAAQRAVDASHPQHPIYVDIHEV
jgi:hypothetical protein